MSDEELLATVYRGIAAREDDDDAFEKAGEALDIFGEVLKASRAEAKQKTDDIVTLMGELAKRDAEIDRLKHWISNP